ncbi:MAG: BlaI/MecI/CopY family transcriptional regulator [Calditrichaeota bacterium]|nr:MAG: BlaI/MecI/CopY family transcriptional regulator [Calditrichota bacterium]MBL1207709.1 BlaI/MecI/CopY family transcriptional regulator [Calditrichota bacterium]NOG47544.1 BlaI/MecI/CopY family transcriptional regulator [Calditrichota bacterium]
MKNPIPEISKSEYDILRILWRQGEQSIREVHDQMPQNYTWAYSTTKTTMDRMNKKGLLNRKEFHGVFLYEPLLSRPQGLFRWVQFMADRVLEMSYGEVVSLFAQNKKLSTEEIEELRSLLDGEK